MWKILLALTAVITSLQGVPVKAQNKEQFANAINMSGRQRMLSQKMALETMLLELKVDTDEGKRNATMKLFKESLETLTNGDPVAKIPAPPTEKLKGQLVLVKNIFSDFAAALQKMNIETISRKSGLLLRESNKAVRMYEKESKKSGIEKAGRVINIAGRQRMLTQKMALEACLIALDHNPNRWSQSLKATRKLFQNSLKALINGNKTMKVPPTTHPAIRDQLQKVARLWDNYAKTLDAVVVKGGGNPENLGNLATRSQVILKEMDRAVTMFAQAQTMTASAQ